MSSSSSSLTNCCICLESMKQPIKTLPCLHSSCSTCIDQLMTKGKPFKCPLCRAPFDAAVLDPNSFTSHLLSSSGQGVASDPNNVKCEICEETEAQGYCKECSQFFCPGCKKVHSKQKISAHHQFVSIEDGLVSASVRTTHCHKHPQSEMNSYCKNCKEACCAECFVEKHSGHNVIKLSSLAEKFKGEISTLVKKWENRDQALSKAIKETTDVTVALRKQAKLTEEQVHGIFDKMRLLLDEREAELIGGIEKVVHQKEKELTIQRDDLEFLLKGIRDAVEFSKRLVADGNGGEIAASHKPVLGRFRTLENEMKMTPLSPVTNEAIEFLGGEAGLEETKKVIKAVGAIAAKGISSAKKPVLKFGSSGKGDGQFSSPRAVACNSDGEIIVADTSNHRVQVFDKEGRFLKKFGASGNEDGQFSYPLGVAVDFRNNQILVADSSNHRVQIFDRKGGFLRSFGSYGKGEGQLISPYGVEVDLSTGNYFVADFDNHRVQVFDSNGVFVRKFGTKGDGQGQFQYPRGIGFMSNGNVVVVEKTGSRLQVFDTEGNFLKEIAGDEYLRNPRYLAVDSEDNMLVADSYNNRIQVFDVNGNHVKTIGTGELSDPTGICMDKWGRIIVSEKKAHRISIF